jgi:hypothetical protein
MQFLIRNIVILLAFMAFLQPLTCNAQEQTSAWQTIKHDLIWRPYLTVGYGVPNFLTINNVVQGDFFSDLTAFKNITVGAGLRIHQNFGIEARYNTMRRYASGTTGSDSTTLQYIAITANVYTPPLNLKFLTLEASVGIGIAGSFGNTRKIGTNTTDYAMADSAHFVFGASVIVGFAKVAAVRGFVECLQLYGNGTVANKILYGIESVPIALTAGLAFDIYLF